MVQAATSFQPVLGKFIRKNASYNAWATCRIVEWLSSKDAHLLTSFVPSSFPSIRESLIHISNTERFWLDVLRQQPLTFSTDDFEALDIPSLLQRVVEQSEALCAYIDRLSEVGLIEEVNLDTPWVKGSRPRYEFLQHVVNHTTYHRGQIITIARNLGLTDAPMTDFNYYNMMSL
jgi:uncharacterized damage-inducible protein DinB